MKDFSREVTLLCPTCGNDQFEYPDESEEQELDEKTLYKCTDCGIEYTKAELLELNQEVINNHIEAIEADIFTEIEKAFRRNR